jgi:hypothetical protein
VENADRWRLEPFQNRQARQLTTTAVFNKRLQTRNINMHKSKITNDNGSMPTELVAVESKQTTSTTTAPSGSGIALYSVAITVDIQSTYSADVPVYASSPSEAASKVQARMDAHTLDGDIEMQDGSSGGIMSYADVTYFFGGVCRIVEDSIAVAEDRCDPADVLAAEVKRLQTTIIWDVGMQAKLKAFLESLAATQVSAA